MKSLEIARPDNPEKAYFEEEEAQWAIIYMIFKGWGREKSMKVILVRLDISPISWVKLQWPPAAEEVRVY